MQIKELLKKVRLETGMTQKEFAEYFYIPLRTYEQWERGKREMPEYTLRLLLYKICSEELAENVTEDMINEVD